MEKLKFLESIKAQIVKLDNKIISGKVKSVKGTLIEASGIAEFSAIGSKCKITTFSGQQILCELVGFDKDIALLMPFAEPDGVNVGANIELTVQKNEVFPSKKWLGRVLNGFGDPIDEGGMLELGKQGYRLKSSPPNPQKRNRVGGKIDLGVRALDSFASCCYGQRLGIFAGSGVGKSVLISMLTKYANTDVKVIGLIGERGREVQEFIQEYLGPQGLEKAVIIVATGDESALMRKQATFLTMTVAEYFRDQGQEVLCIIDSVTRFAMAQREIGLTIGEPPSSKGYTPTVFSELPKLLERAGPGIGKGNITGLFSVLVEGDDHNEPIADAVRGILDGHIVLNREIAERGRFPAIDVLKSVSRTMPKCNSDKENKIIIYAKKMLATYNDMAEMIRLGAYKKGSNPEVDLAIQYYPQIESFLNQDPDSSTPMETSYKLLAEILNLKEYYENTEDSY